MNTEEAKDSYDTPRFNGASLLEIRQSPRQFCDPETVEALADRVMALEAQIEYALYQGKEQEK